MRFVSWSVVLICFDILLTTTVDAICTTFPVAPVETTKTNHPAVQSLAHKDLQRWASKGEILTLENAQFVHPLADGFDYRVKNAFIGTVFSAYSQHYPLELSVEDIWVIIAQGISIHLNKNAEKFRHLLVSHEGKKELDLNVNDLVMLPESRVTNNNTQIPAISWPEAVRRMCDLIKADMKTDLTSIISKPFSETTSVQQAVFDATLMDSVKAYYSFRVSVTCGIPQITLCGSAEDYQSVIDRLNQLKTIFTDLHWWLEPLISHVTKFKDSVEGKPDTDWWRKMVGRYNEMSGSDKLTGWLVDFIPYIDYGNGRYYTVQRVYPTNDNLDTTMDKFHGIEFSHFNEAVTQTNFTLDNDGYEIKMKLVAGFFGIGQNPETSALRPVLGWATALPSLSVPNTKDEWQWEDL